MEVILDELTPKEFFNHGGVVKIKIIGDNLKSILDCKKKYTFFEYSKYVKFLNSIILGICDKYPDTKVEDRFTLMRSELDIEANIGNRVYILDSNYDKQSSLLYCLFYYYGDRDIKKGLVSGRDPYGIKNVCFSLVDESDEKWPDYCAQREKRGFDDSELWNLDGTIAKFISPRLSAYVKTVIESNYNSSEMPFDEWLDILKKMDEGFKIMSSDKNRNEDEVDKMNDAIDLFNKYFFNLWI